MRLGLVAGRATAGRQLAVLQRIAHPRVRTHPQLAGWDDVPKRGIGCRVVTERIGEVVQRCESEVSCGRGRRGAANRGPSVAHGHQRRGAPSGVPLAPFLGATSLKARATRGLDAPPPPRVGSAAMLIIAFAAQEIGNRFRLEVPNPEDYEIGRF
jgi:hypothetical protein